MNPFMLLISVPTKSFMKHMYSSFTPKLREKQEAGEETEREREGRGEGEKKGRRGKERKEEGRGKEGERGKEEGRRDEEKGGKGEEGSSNSYSGTPLNGHP